jgi:hypothetical protein
MNSSSSNLPILQQVVLGQAAHLAVDNSQRLNSGRVPNQNQKWTLSTNARDLKPIPLVSVP